MNENHSNGDSCVKNYKDVLKKEGEFLKNMAELIESKKKPHEKCIYLMKGREYKLDGSGGYIDKSWNEFTEEQKKSVLERRPHAQEKCFEGCPL